MITIEETILKDGFVCHSLSEPYDTHKHFHSRSERNAKLNLESLVQSYDFEQCWQEYEDDDEKDGEGYPLHDLDYYIRQAPLKTEKGIFLHFSDDDESFLRRDSVLRLIIDGKKYKLPCYFAPNGHRMAVNYTTDLYYKITSNILKELAAATSISLSYETGSDDAGFKNADLDGFQEYALSFYEGYYIEDQGSPEEKEKLRQELQAQKDAIKKREEEEKVRKEREKAEEKAARKAEWDEADPLSKVWIMLKRNWQLVLLILLILYCWAMW